MHSRSHGNEHICCPARAIMFTLAGQNTEVGPTLISLLMSLSVKTSFSFQKYVTLMEKRQLEDTKRERQAPSKKKSTSHTTNYKCGRSFAANKSSERGEKGASCSDVSLNVLFMCVYALFQELFTVDVSEAAEEGQ